MGYKRSMSKRPNKKDDKKLHNLLHQSMTQFVVYVTILFIIPARNRACFGNGVSFTFKATENYGIRFFLDYNLAALTE